MALLDGVTGVRRFRGIPYLFFLNGKPRLAFARRSAIRSIGT